MNVNNDCTTPLGAGTEVTLGASPNFGLTANELNSLGYTQPICYRCEILPTDQTSIFFDYLITVVGNPLDCSPSMTSNGFNPAPVEYNSAGSEVTIAADYTAIFTHTQQNDCKLVTCSLMMFTDCTVPLGAQTEVILGASPNFGLIQTN